MLNLKLKAIVPNSDFRKSEKTLYDAFINSRSYPGDLKSGEAFLFLSKTGNQLLWFFSQVHMIQETKGRGVLHDVYDSRKWRITGGTWHPYMLADYAEHSGIRLLGIKRFEEIHDERRNKR